ncbi:Hpt domain-containing protein [Aromatoleum bremense]|uniref:Hpt domain-containing protein n=1 Tax=Aromatoleum bremense TaxID=76115 RepID=UPI00145DF81A|nr:Hpt domain-containing protein [Aromatoleum bremense]
MFDRRATLDNLGQDLALMRLMAQTFIDDIPRMFAELRAALSCGDGPAAVRASHSLKGSAANFGAAPLVGWVGGMERDCRAGDLAGASARTDEAARLTAVLVAELWAELSGPA